MLNRAIAIAIIIIIIIAISRIQSTGIIVIFYVAFSESDRRKESRSER